MKVVIFEDEIHNAERLMQLLHSCDPAIEIVAVISSLAEGIAWLERRQQVDLMLMDIQLSDGNCFELFNQSEVHTPIIFTTAYDSFALQAFKVNSIDYLLKPIEQSALQKSLKKLETYRPAAQPLDINRLAEAFMKRSNSRFVGRISNQLIYVKEKDIAYLHFTKGIVIATTFSNQHIPLDYSLEQMERSLDPNSFFRINRQFIINIDAIRKITTYYNSRLVLQLEPVVDSYVIVSRDRVNDFKNWLEGK